MWPPPPQSAYPGVPQYGSQPGGYPQPGAPQYGQPPGSAPYGTAPGGFPQQQQQQYGQQQPYGQQPPQTGAYPQSGGYPQPQHAQSQPHGQQTNYSQPQQYPGQQQAYPQPQQYGQQAYPQQHMGAPVSQAPAGQQGYPPASQPHQAFGGYAGAAPNYGVPGGYNNAVIDAKYCAPHEVVLFMKETTVSMSGDDFDAYDTQGQVAFHMDADSITVNGKRTLYDAHRKPVLSMKKQLMSLHKTWSVHRGANASDSGLLCKIKTSKVKGAPTFVASIFMTGNTSSHFSTPMPDYTVSGDLRSKGFFVYKGQQPVAEIARKLPIESARLRFLGKDSYAVKVFPTFDHAFVLALCVAVDESFFD